MSEIPGWATLRAHQSAVRTLDFAADGLLLVSGDEEGVVVLWSLETRRPLAQWEAHTNALLATKFWGPDNYIVTHGRDNLLRLWKPAAAGPPALVHTQDVNALNFCAVALAPALPGASHWDFATPASTASERVDLYRLDAATLQLSRPFRALDAAEALPLDTQLDDEAMASQRRGLLGTVMALQLTERWLVAGYESGHVAVFDRSTAQVRTLVQAHRSPVLSLQVTGPTTAYVTSADRQIARVDLASGGARPAARLQHRGVASVSVCGSLVVTAGWDGKVRLFQEDPGSPDLAEVSAFPGGRQSGITAAIITEVHPGPKRRLRPLPDKWIAVAGKDGRIGLFAVHSELTRSK